MKKDTAKKPIAEFVGSKECKELVDLRYICKESNVCEDGRGFIVLGYFKPSLKKAQRDFDFVPCYIVKATSEQDQIFLQNKTEENDFSLLIFWNPDRTLDVEATGEIDAEGNDIYKPVEPTADKVRGGYKVQGGLERCFTDNSRSSSCYIFKTKRIHHINDDQPVHFFSFKPAIEDEEELQQVS
jgi:hypothetical protein